MKMRRILLAALIISMVASLCPVYAAALDTYSIDKVLVQTYPGSGGNDLPYVSQEYSAFYAQTSTSGVVVTGWSLVDGSGNQCSGKVQNTGYTLSVNVTSQVVNCFFTSDTKAYINNEAANISVSSDGLSATVSRVIQPRLVAPTIWKNPGDESHESGNTFSFVASASPYYDSVQWYVKSPYNSDYKVEDISTVFPGVNATVHDHGSGGSTCNLNNVPVDMDGWMVYCKFIGVGGQTNTSNAFINVTNAAAVLSTPEPSPAVQIVETPAPSIYIVETPEPTQDIWVVEEAWSDVWTYDRENHWHASIIPQVTDVSDKAPHDMVWTETRAATKKEDGEEQGVCSVCGYTETRSVLYVKPERTSIELPTGLKWVVGVVGGIIVLAAAVVFIQYMKDKARRKRRAKMAGRREGRH